MQGDRCRQSRRLCGSVRRKRNVCSGRTEPCREEEKNAEKGQNPAAKGKGSCGGKARRQ